ncbi:MAG: hypothetical protein AAB654_07135 [Acidobacteriota bacterium]|nr:hypothetical protein [Bryobacterales bacterium]
MYLFTMFNFVTLVLMGLTVWLGVSRQNTKLGTNWPLFYYVFLVGYLKVFEGSLDPYMVYVGVVSALFLRFEFIGGWFLKFVRGTELFILAYVIYRCLALILML